MAMPCPYGGEEIGSNTSSILDNLLELFGEIIVLISKRRSY